MMFAILFGGRKRRNGVRVGNDFGTLFTKMIPTNSVTILNPDPPSRYGTRGARIGVWKYTEKVSFLYQEPPIKKEEQDL